MKNKIAVAVGYYFGFVSEEDIKDILLEPVEVSIKFDSKVYDLHKGKTYADSRKLDDLLDKTEEYSIDAYKVNEEPSSTSFTIVNGIEIDLMYYVNDFLMIRKMIKDEDFKTRVSIRFEKEFMSVGSKEVSGNVILGRVVNSEVKKWIHENWEEIQNDKAKIRRFRQAQNHKNRHTSE